MTVVMAAAGATQLVPFDMQRIGVEPDPPSLMTIQEYLTDAGAVCVGSGAVALVYTAKVVGYLKVIRPKLVSSLKLKVILQLGTGYGASCSLGDILHGGCGYDYCAASTGPSY